MIPRHERMDLHVNPKFKQLIMDQRGKTETLGDAVVRLVCQALQIDPHIYALERLPAGRPPVNDAPRKKRKRS